MLDKDTRSPMVYKSKLNQPMHVTYLDSHKVS